MADAQRVPTTPERHGGWSLETALDYVLAVISGNDKRYEERFLASQKALEIGLAGTMREISVALAASKEAVLKAENATEKRFESVNEFRGTLDNQQRTLIPRSEVDVLIRSVTEKIGSLEKIVDAMSVERKGIVAGWGYAVGVVGFLLAIGSLILIGIRFVKG